MKFSLPAAVGALGLLLVPVASHAAVQGWLSWRGPAQNGTSLEKGLPDKVDPKAPLWRADFPGQSTPVIANGKLYIMGYFGEGADLQEGVTCYEAETGKQLWRQAYSDYLSDTIYLRYATSSPAIDPETGNVYIQGTQGILAAFTPDGKLLWKHSLMESFGRLTFPNSRTASPLIDRDLVLTRGIMANWGAQGPAGDRMYGFDKKTGELVWASTTGERPKDNSYSHMYLGWLDGKRVFYTATGDGNVFCANARTGEPLWRVPLFRAGINATVLVHNNDKVIAVFGTPYEPGKMVALKISHVAPTNAVLGPVEVPLASVQLWEADVSTSSSHPILVGDRIYVVAEKGDLACIDANTGKIYWKHKLGIEQRNAALTYADGKLYVPILDDPSVKEGGGEAGSSGGLYIIKPTDAKAEVISQVTLDGRCFGTPVAYNGKVYIQTTRHIYCFGKRGNNPGLPAVAAEEKWPAPGPATQLQAIPSEVLLRPGQSASFRLRSLDAHGLPVEDIKDVKAVKWAGYIPPTAKVKASMKGGFDAEGKLVAAPDPVPSAGAYEATLGNLKGYIRARVLPYLPIKQDFESAVISEKHETEPDTMFAYPPLPWIGARFKFEVREREGNKVLTKTIDNKFFQRATVFIGEENTSNYTIEADVMSDGNKRKMSDVGVINQHYLIVMKGNEQKLEINSNQERLRVPAAEEPSNLKWSPGEWYRLKARVDIAADGSGMVRAKAWKKSDPEPAGWTIEVPHKHAHASGSPGLYGFAPQEMRVYIDNVTVTPNK
jgi:outer membrane protein assembly factor BamB